MMWLRGVRVPDFVCIKADFVSPIRNIWRDQMAISCLIDSGIQATVSQLLCLQHGVNARRRQHYRTIRGVQAVPSLFKISSRRIRNVVRQDAR